MKLLIVQPYLLGFGGAERFVLEVAKHYNAPVMCVKYDPDKTFSEFKDVNVLVDGNTKNNLGLGWYYWNVKVRYGYDLLFTNLAPSDLIRHKNAPVLAYIHDPKKSFFEPLIMNLPLKSRLSYFVANAGYRFLFSQVAKKFEGVATNSNYTAAILKRQLHRTDIETIYPGIDFEDYYNENYTNYFLFVGRLDPKKRIEYALKAYELFQSKSKTKTTVKDKAFKLVIVLSGSKTSDYYIKLKQEINRIINGKIEVYFNLSEEELKEKYANATGVLFTSKQESFGLVPLEAMASHKPVISVNEGGPRETIVDGKTGFLVDSAEEMADKMLLLAENPKLVEKMGKNARKHIEKNFTWNVFFRKFDKALQNAMKRSNQ